MKASSRSAKTVLYLVSVLLAGPCFAGIIVAASGPVSGDFAVEGVSVGFSTSTAFHDVEISALLTNGGFPSSAGTAYLTTSIGSGTTIADEIAQVDISLGCSFCQQEVVLFSGLDLAAGTYWLTFGEPAPPASGLSIFALFPAVAVTSSGTSFLGFDAVSDGNGPFPPGSSISAVLTSNGVLPDFSVSTVPEPSELGPTGAGIVILSMWAWRGSAGRKPS